MQIGDLQPTTIDCIYTVYNSMITIYSWKRNWGNRKKRNEIWDGFETEWNECAQVRGLGRDINM